MEQAESLKVKDCRILEDEINNYIILLLAILKGEKIIKTQFIV